MYPRVSSYAAICGRNPVASIGKQTAPSERRHQSDLLDEAIEETFPASDPVYITGPDDPEHPVGDAGTRKVTVDTARS